MDGDILRFPISPIEFCTATIYASDHGYNGFGQKPLSQMYSVVSLTLSCE